MSDINARETYSIEQISATTVIVFANSYINPLSLLPSIEAQLTSMSFRGVVIFDLLLANGHASNRFVASYMANGKIDRKALKVVNFRSLDTSVKGKIKAFYKSNDSYVQSSFILSDEEKKTLLQ